jgi:3-oxoadipate enol-lactonase
MDQISLSYSDKGSGPPVVLLHAFPLNRRMWDVQIKAWLDRYRVIAPDWRGFGESPLGTGAFSMESCADDLRQLLTHLAVREKIILLGVSMGGYIAFEFVRKYQELLHALVLVATQPVADSEAARKTRYETAEFVQKEGTGALAERLIPKLLGKTTLGTRPQVVERVCALIQSNSAEGIAKACHGLAWRRDSTPILQQIRIPTLIIAGSEDAIVPRDQAGIMRQEIANSQLSVIERSGHLITLEQPDEFDKAALNFLSPKVTNG